ncbi:hypothetical protein EJP82_07345 [Paenibacillus anaericanus]|uniref:BtrH N-terminal domain-containing protein n=1 Tax=Paenibacillus anaericanus TaxID=170367 RepID=A0A433YCA8_9BACL|nr:hypothetical protein [Paenibacillus anaericanus]RUT47512.1 hypothetical protein EJP82_07345 [Paenibacillus anaericanus]
MSSIYLEKLVMKRESKSFIDSLYAVLSAAGQFDGPKYLLSGLTGMAFKLSIHERLLPMSVTAYGQWGTEHQPAVDNLGYLTITDSGRVRHSTFRHFQQAAIQDTRQNLDQGMGVIYWIPEFGVIHGYDDVDRVFFAKDGISSDDQIILYDNFGLNFTSFWYYQTIGEKVDIPIEQSILESLRLAIHDWDTPFKLLPGKEVANGKEAYTYWINALNSGDYDAGGAMYILDSHIVSRTEIRNYLQYIQGTWAGLKDVVGLFEQLLQHMEIAATCIVKDREARRIDPTFLQLFIQSLESARLLEDQAMGIFKQISAGFPDPKRTTLPRWGTHSAR